MDRYVNRSTFLQVFADDLISYGNIGLLKATAKFDWQWQQKGNEGGAFSTYAIGWIKKEVRSGVKLEENPVIKSHRVHLLLAKIRRAEDILMAEGKVASDETIAAITKIPVEEVAQIRHHPANNLAFFAELDETDNDRGNFIEGIHAESSSGFEEQALTRIVVRECMQPLTPKEAIIIALRFGKEESLKETGRQFNVTREAIRQREALALTTIRQEMEKQQLQPPDSNPQIGSAGKVLHLNRNNKKPQEHLS